MFEHVLQYIISNPLLTGMSFTALLTGFVYHLRSIPYLVLNSIFRFFTIEFTVRSGENAYEWIERWISIHPAVRKKTRVSLRSYERYSTDEGNYALTIDNGSFWFRWGGKLLFVVKRVEDGKSFGKRQETITFRAFGRSQEIVRKIVEDAVRNASDKDMVNLLIWREDYWKTLPSKTPRSLNTITLKVGMVEDIVKDITRFETNKDWYTSRGIPYRRGFLFSGPPGTGKTSLVVALAGHFEKPVCILNLGSVTSDSALFNAISSAPPKSIIVIEDIDCASNSSKTRENAAGDGGAKELKRVMNVDADDDDETGVTKAGLLNALDGLTTPDGRIFIMTTNYPERLDAALIRPGRADVHWVLDYLDTKDQQRMAERFYGVDKFVGVDHPVSPASLQAAFMQHPDNPEAAREMLLKI